MSRGYVPYPARLAREQALEAEAINNAEPTRLSGTRLSVAAFPDWTLAGGTTPGVQSVADFDAATFYEGEDYWNVPGSALPLGMIVDAPFWYFPEEDLVYNVRVELKVEPSNAADYGKFVKFVATGWDAAGHATLPLLQVGARATLWYQDFVFKGDLEQAPGISAYFTPTVAITGNVNLSLRFTITA